MTFFSYYNRNHFIDALDTIEKLQVIPLKISEVDSKVQEFITLTEDIKKNIPTILLATMTILQSQYKEVRSNVQSPVSQRFGLNESLNHSSSVQREESIKEIREKARALITFAGMVPYRMPADINSRLVQMEVLMKWFIENQWKSKSMYFKF